MKEMFEEIKNMLKNEPKEVYIWLPISAWWVHFVLLFTTNFRRIK